jgi:cation transport ATPase
VVLQQPSPYELVIGGMTCAACAARVQAKLNRLDGVTAAVNMSTERAWVSAPPNLSPRDLDAVPDAIALARATCTTIRRNLAWAFCYNILAIPLAAFGFLNPLVAAATMTLSSVFVVWNSLRLRRFSPLTNLRRPSGSRLEAYLAHLGPARAGQLLVHDRRDS